MDVMLALQSNGHWRMAVWALRVAYAGLTIVLVGLVVNSAGSTPWVLAVGVFIWLAAAGVTVVGFLWGRHDLPEPRPGFWSIRFMLISNTVHSQPHGTHRSAVTR